MFEELASEAIADVTTTDPVAFARAVAELPAGVFVFHGDEHLVIGANRAARTFFGDRPGIVGLPIREVYPEITPAVTRLRFDTNAGMAAPVSSRSSHSPGRCARSGALGLPEVVVGGVLGSELLASCAGPRGSESARGVETLDVGGVRQQVAAATSCRLGRLEQEPWNRGWVGLHAVVHLGGHHTAAVWQLLPRWSCEVVDVLAVVGEQVSLGDGRSPAPGVVACVVLCACGVTDKEHLVTGGGRDQGIDA